MAVLNDDITYTGCGRCATELDTDANGIYVPCYPCLPHMAVRRYYRYDDIIPIRTVVASLKI